MREVLGNVRDKSISFFNDSKSEFENLTRLFLIATTVSCTKIIMGPLLIKGNKSKLQLNVEGGLQGQRQGNVTGHISFSFIAQDELKVTK